MNALFFIVFTVFLIIFQTIVFPSFSWFSQCFDLMIMNVIFLSLVSSHYSAILLIVIVGVTMDSISGVVFFHYMFSYLWIYLIVQLFKQFVFQQSIVFILIISLVSVLIQQGLIVFSVFIGQGRQAVWQMDFTLMAKQLLWGGLFIPSGVWLINMLHKSWLYMGKMVKKQFAHRYKRVM